MEVQRCLEHINQKKERVRESTVLGKEWELLAEEKFFKDADSEEEKSLLHKAAKLWSFFDIELVLKQEEKNGEDPYIEEESSVFAGI